jgi:hypothetical protein
MEIDNLAPPRCTATNRAGEQCGRAPIPGGSVCNFHGGRAPQIVAAAQRRLLEGAYPAVARLRHLIEAPVGLCATCGRSDDTRSLVQAIRTLLDRVPGLGPNATVTVKPGTLDLSELTSEQLAERAEQLAAQLRASDAPRALTDGADATAVKDVTN